MRMIANHLLLIWKRYAGAYYFFIFVVTYTFLFVSQVAGAQSTDEIIIFLQSKSSPVAEQFNKRTLAEINKIAKSMQIPVTIKDALRGAPSEVTITPMIIFQNHHGRSIYQGRATTVRRIRNFIRTAKVISQKDVSNPRKMIPVWRIGRARIWAPLKVSNVTGTLPDGHNHKEFIQNAMNSINEGFRHFKLEKSVELDRGDRGFYMDFYPWRAEDGTLFLSVALYSQFDCKEPIYKTKNIGSWEDRRQLFQQAARLLEDQVKEQMADPARGDGFDCVPSDVPYRTWEELNLALPKAPLRHKKDRPAHFDLPQKWELARPAPNDPPLILFHFPAPLDRYRGEVVEAAGRLTLPEKQNLKNAEGFIEVDTSSAVTMGEPALDEAIKGSMMLYAKKFPAARFEIASIGSKSRAFEFGQLSLASMNGKFTLKGKTIPLTVPTQIEPVIGSDNQPQLIMQSAFSINLSRFDIQGAQGPPPANHTLMFEVNAVLKPIK